MTLRLAGCAAILRSNGLCQQPSARPGAEVRAGHQVVSHALPDLLAQLSDSLQKFASKVSPAVVEIGVAGFGPAEAGDYKNMALIVRRRSKTAAEVEFRLSLISTSTASKPSSSRNLPLIMD
jgi:hypothetical protein